MTFAQRLEAVVKAYYGEMHKYPIIRFETTSGKPALFLVKEVTEDSAVVLTDGGTERVLNLVNMIDFQDVTDTEAHNSKFVKVLKGLPSLKPVAMEVPVVGTVGESEQQKEPDHA